MEKNAIILGGGIAGLACARELAASSVQCTIVEKGPLLGGHVARFACKATDRCQRCAACSLEDLVHRVRAEHRVTTMTRTTLTDAQRVNGQFGVALLTRPRRIVPDSCDCCGACRDVCPAAGAITYSAFDGSMAIDEDRCLYFRDESCRLCVEACPRGAIELVGREETSRVTASAVILATGFTPYDAAEKPRFGFGRIPGVVSATELDGLLKDDVWQPGGDDTAPRHVAFIQCVGSRDTKIGRNYCSRVCCGYALRMARLLRCRFPRVEPTMFYMDIQTFERDVQRTLMDAANEVRLIRAIPSEVRAGVDGRPELVYQAADDKKTSESFDLVVLSVGISPARTASAMGRLFGVDRNVDGFLGEDNESVQTAAEGVFVAGTVQGPRSIPDTVSHALRAAAAVGEYLGR